MEFSNTVTRNSRMGRKGDPIKSTSVMEHVSMISNKKKQTLLESEMEEEVLKEDKRKKVSDMIERQTNKKKRFNASQRVYEQALEVLFKNIMVESFMDSLVLDEWAVNDYSSALESAVVDFIDEHGGYSMLTEAIDSSNSKLLENMNNLIKSTANKISQRVLAESKENEDIDPSDLELDLTAEETEEFDAGKSDLQLEEVTNVIKDKVINVVKDEKERSKQQEEIEKELESSEEDTDGEDSTEYTKESEESDDLSQFEGEDLEENEDQDTDGDAVEEAKLKRKKNKKGFIHPYSHRVKGVQESTLFNTLMQETMKEAVAESVSHNESAYDSYTDDDDDTDLQQPNYTLNDVSKSEPDTSLSKFNDEVESHDSHQSPTLDLDLILADSVSQYTLLEMFHTFKLASMSATDIKQKSIEVLNK